MCASFAADYGKSYLNKKIFLKLIDLTRMTYIKNFNDNLSKIKVPSIPSNKLMMKVFNSVGLGRKILESKKNL